METKTCSKCRKDLPVTNFSKDRSRKCGIQSYCINCHSKSAKENNRSISGLVGKIYRTQLSNSKKRGQGKPSYTKAQLLKWITSQQSFKPMYLRWVESGYNKYLVPSVDRISNLDGYSFDNIQLMTWAENEEKSHEDLRQGNDRRNMKPVIQYTTEGLFVEEYYSGVEAWKLTGISKQHINSCCHGKRGRKTVGGFIWKFKTDVENERKNIEN